MQEITSRKNPLVQHLKKLGAEREYRDACGAFLCDGLKLYQEALQCGAEITLVAASRRELLDGFCRQEILVPEDVLVSISPVKTPQPLMFICKKPAPAPADGARRVLVLDGVQDPGNVGTLLRSAVAFAVDQVILTGASVDLYNPKTVRATMGALFRQRVCAMSVDEIINYVNQNDLTLLGADAAEGQSSVSCADSSFGKGAYGRLAIVIGSEGQGLSPALLAHCHGRIRIPMEAASESLNAGVAGSILMWEMYRRG